MKKGFTLIELLAVIVILAIIALIATPIVLNIISDTKESAGLRSAEMYLDAVEQAIMRENMEANASFNPTNCIIKDGNLKCDGKEVIVEVDGEKPKSGSISFEDGKINEVNLSFENTNPIIKNEDGALVYAPSVKKTCEAVTAANATYRIDDETTPAGKIPQGNFDYGDEYICTVDSGDPKRFFVVSSTATTVSLLMDHNIINAGVEWNTDGGTKPTAAEKTLNDATANWSEGIEVRLPTVAEIGSPSGGDFQILNLGSSGFSMNDYETNPVYYWTADYNVDEQCPYIVAGDTYMPEGAGWQSSGGIKTPPMDDFDGIGVRPVITISKNSLSL